jgi:hypothetical protein
MLCLGFLLILTTLVSSAQIYDNFSSICFDTSKWEIRQDVEGQPFMEEYGIDLGSGNFHTQENTIGDKRVYLVPKHNFTTGDVLEYDTNLISKENHYMQMVLLTGEQYIRIGIFGYISGVQGYDELGISHIKIEFQENNLHLIRTAPSGLVLTDDLPLTKTNGNYDLYIGSVSGHNGRTHIDYDNFQIYKKIIVGAYQIDNDFYNITNECFDTLRTKRILFGSRSWGLNTVDGLKALAKENPKYNLTIEQYRTDSPSNQIIPNNTFDNPKLVQYVFDYWPTEKRWQLFNDYIRNNSNKIDFAFEYLYSSGLQDAQSMYYGYNSAFDSLRHDYPNINFAFATHHVSTMQTPNSTWNIQSKWYSDMVFEKYTGVVPILDIRDIVSTKPDGEICQFEYNGTTYRSLCPEYNNNSGDGIHPSTPEAEKRLARGVFVLLSKVYCEQAQQNQTSQCTQNSDCDDGLYCNGVETCLNEKCIAGTNVQCNDGITCTSDSCNEITDICEYTPNNNLCLPLPFGCLTCSCDKILGCKYLPENCEHSINPSMKLYLPFDGNANDESGNGNNGVVYGATLTADRNGNLNSAYYFDGVNNYIDVGTSKFGIDNTNEFTISMWVKSVVPRNAYTRTLIIRGKYVYPYWFMYYGNKIKTAVRTNTPNYFLSNKTLVEDQWNHIAYSYKDGETNIYLNGVLDKTDSLTGNLNFYKNTEKTIIGANIDSGNSFKGTIDEVRIYNKALTPEEIAELFNR